MFMMKTNQLTEFEFQKRVAIHDYKFGSIAKVGSCQLDRAASPQGAQFLRVLNRNVPRSAVTECFFDLVAEITGAHNQTADSLATELPDQQFKERAVSHRGKRLGRGWHYGPQARAQTPNEQNGFDVVPVLHYCFPR
jgi:hypothetical protein